MSWDRRFADPIELPGKNLTTLRDAAEYITELPKAEHDADEWQAAMRALLLARGIKSRMLSGGNGLAVINMPRSPRQTRGSVTRCEKAHAEAAA
jgi:hypothetical protein